MEIDKNSQFEFQWIHSEKEFIKICTLLRSKSQTKWNPYADPFFYISWWKTYKAKNLALQSLLVLIDSKPVGLLPLYIQSTKLKKIPTKVLRLMGDQYVGASVLTLIAPFGYQSLLLKGLWHKLINHTSFDLIRLGPLDETHTNSLAAKTKFVAGPPYATVHLPKSTDEFWEVLSKSKRKELRRRKRYLEGLGTICIGEYAGDNYEAQSHLIRLNKARFLETGVEGGFKDPKLCAFFKEFADLLSQDQSLKIFTLSINEKVIAALSIFVSETDWYTFAGGHDPKWNKGSPAGILDMELFELAISRGIESYDFGPGTQEYKLRFGAHVKKTVTIDAPQSLPWKLAYQLLRRA